MRSGHVLMGSMFCCTLLVSSYFAGYSGLGAAAHSEQERHSHAVMLALWMTTSTQHAWLQDRAAAVDEAHSACSVCVLVHRNLVFR